MTNNNEMCNRLASAYVVEAEFLIIKAANHNQKIVLEHN